MKELEFTIPGRAVPKARARVLRSGRCYTPRRTAEYEIRVKLVGKSAARYGVMSGPLGMDVEFYICRRAASRPDLDNLVKSIKDALNGVAYVDDSQVVFLQAHKIKCAKGNERTCVKVYQIAEVEE